MRVEKPCPQCEREQAGGLTTESSDEKRKLKNVHECGLKEYSSSSSS